MKKFFASTANQTGYVQDLTPTFFKVSFGAVGDIVPEDWNSFEHVNSSSIKTGLVDTEGNARNIVVKNNFWGNNAGTDNVTTGDNSGYVPDLVMKRNLYSFGGGQITFEGLNPNKKYIYRIFATNKGTGDKTTVITPVGGVAQELQTLIAGVPNTQNYIATEALLPTIMGVQVINFAKADGTNLCFLNSIEIEEQVPIETTLNGQHLPYYGEYNNNGTDYLQESYVYFPQDYSTREKFPLLIFLSGQGEIGKPEGLDIILTQGMPYQIEQGVNYSFVCASPYNSANYGEIFSHWKPQQVKQYTDWAVNEFKIDPNRVYITGLSVGALGVWMTLTEYNNLYAAALVMAGFSIDPDYPEYNARTAACSIDEELPITVYHGDNDPMVDFSESQLMVDALNACPLRTGELVFNVVDSDVHDIWTAIYSNPLNFQWLLSKRKTW